MSKEQYYSQERIKVDCTWGFGEDILITDTYSDNFSLPSYIGISVQQAEILVQELSAAIARVKELQAILEKDLA